MKWYFTGSDMQEVIGTAIALYLLSNGRYTANNCCSILCYYDENNLSSLLLSYIV